MIVRLKGYWEILPGEKAKNQKLTKKGCSRTPRGLEMGAL